MKMNYRIICLLLGLQLLSSCNSNGTSSDSVDGSGTLAGHIFDPQTNERLSGVKVTILGPNKVVTTNAGGEFEFPDLAPSSYIVEYQKDNFGVGRSAMLRVNAGEKSYVPIAMRSIVGKWDMAVTYANNNTSHRTLTIDKDGGFTAYYWGSWTFIGDKIKLTDKYSRAVYNGVLTETMNGTFSEGAGYEGTWTAKRD